MTDGLKVVHREAIIAKIAVNDRVERAVLFGSRATGTNTVSSDVDIALFGSELTLTDQARLAAALDEIPMAQSVDLLLYDSVTNRTLREHIRRHGVEWFARPVTRDSERATPWFDTRDSALSEAWSTMPFTDAFLINPAVSIERGGPTPFVDMAAIDPSLPAVHSTEVRKFRGSGSRFRNGDTLMARITPCLENGKIARYYADSDLDVGHGSTEFIVVRGRPEVTDTQYAFYVTRSDLVRGYAIGQMTGTSGRQRVPAESLAHLDVAVPPLSEQRTIAHILGTLDDKIELNRRMNATLEAMARALFRSWFVDFDPVRAKMEGRDTGLPKDIADLFPDRLVDSELGGIPEGWRIWRLEELADHHTQSIEPSSDPETEFDLFSLPAHDAGQLPARARGRAVKSNKAVVPPDAVLLSKLNPEIPRVWMPEPSSGRLQVCSTEFLVFTPRSPATRSLLFSLFTDASFRETLQSLVTGTSKSHQRVPPNALKQREVLAGTDALFRSFDKLARPVLAHTVATRGESRCVAGLRDTLLPKLVSGELRVSGVETACGGRDDRPTPVGAHDV